MTPRKLLHGTVLVALLLGLSGCGTMDMFGGSNAGPAGTRPVTAPVEDRDKTLQSALYWEDLANNSGPPLRQEYQLNAVDQLLRVNHLDDAKRLFDGIDASNLDPVLQLRRSLAGAEIALAGFDAQAALNWLNIPDDQSLPAAQQARIHSLRAQAYYVAGNWLESARERVLLEPFLSDPLDVIDNHYVIWLTLSSLSDEALAKSGDEPNTILRGWMELVAIDRKARYQAADMTALINDWKARYPNHPALQDKVPDLLAQAAQTTEVKGPLALLVPLSGPLAKAGEATRDGFLAALYAQPAASRPTVRIYDSAGDAWSVYQTALRQGAKVVVGPLRKQAVSAIAAHGPLAVPVVALNHVDQGVQDLYQFGLAPEDEAQQVADQGIAEGLQRAIALVPEGAWGDRLLNAFQTRFERFGGKLLEVQRYNPAAHDFSNPIRALLNTDASYAREHLVRRMLGTRVKFQPRRRRDVDLIFLVALPTQARLIRPQFKFHYAGSLPIYATSSVYTGKPNPRLDQDMDGIQFCDMPWTLGNVQQNPLRTEVQKLWPNRMNEYTRLYALGIDAYQLVPALGMLASRPGNHIEGETGTLRLDGQGRIRRTLRWARFEDGVPRPVAYAPAQGVDNGQ